MQNNTYSTSFVAQMDFEKCSIDSIIAKNMKSLSI